MVHTTVDFATKGSGAPAMTGDRALDPDAERALMRLWRLLEQAQALATGSDAMANMEQVAHLCEDASAVAHSLTAARR